MQLAVLEGLQRIEWIVRHLSPGESGHEQVDELVDGRVLEPARIHAKVKNSLLQPLREATREIGLEFLDQQRHALVAAALVPDRVFARHFSEPGAALEFHRQRIGDRALLRVVVVAREALVLDAHYFFAQRIYSRISGNA